MRNQFGAQNGVVVTELTVRPFAASDEAWADGLIGAEFGGRIQARRGELLDVLDLPGLVAERAGDLVGILTYRLDDTDAEIAYIEATERRGGVGTAVLEAFFTSVNPSRAWLVTTNDNVDALRFYQRRGFVISDVRIGAVTHARDTLKPTIGTHGDHGIEIRDEIELERYR